MTISIQKGDIFTMLQSGNYDAACITTNGMLRRNGHAIMGAGVAKACAQRIPQAEALLGPQIRRLGNHVHYIAPFNGKPVYSFPTKHDWRDNSDIELIKQSARELMAIVEKNQLQRVLLPKPGCANGGLNWNDVQQALLPIVDHRIIFVTK